MPFKGVIKKIDLAFLGEGYEGAFLRFRAFCVTDIKDLAGMGVSTDKVAEATDKIMGVIKERFVDGQAPEEDGKLVAVTVEDLDKFPVEVLTKIVEILTGGVALKKD